MTIKTKLLPAELSPKVSPLLLLLLAYKSASISILVLHGMDGRTMHNGSMFDGVAV